MIKKLFICLVLLMFPASTTAMLPPQDFWFCAQPGAIGKQKVLAATPVHRNHADWQHDKKAEKFEEIVKKQTNGEFTGQFDAYCLDYDKSKYAEKHLKKVIKRALKLGFQILHIDVNQERN